jgi:probable O-glycosylation ligase (exosortase A-associated)
VRDLFIVLVVLGSVPITLIKPFFGVLVWNWLGLMNPHMLAYTFAANQPFAQVVGASILVGISFNAKEPKFPPLCGVSVALLAFWVWISFTTPFALNLAYSTERYILISKMLLLVFITMALLTTRVRFFSLVWIMVLSIGFYGVKGGIFTLSSGGGERVWGPSGTFIGGNNEIGLALNMTLPLIRYLQLQTQDKWVRLGLWGAMGLTVMSILGTQSRGALLGLLVTGVWLILKTRNRGPLLALVVLASVPVMTFMPETWHSRMETIKDYEQDASAVGRINAWWSAWYLAQDRIVGGGMGALTTSSIMRAYAPNPNDYHDAHSIYFQVLADHGFIGLGLYLTVLVTSVVTLRSIRLRTRGKPGLAWMSDLAAMINVSLVAFSVSGAFLGLAYFDLMLTQLALVVGVDTLLRRETVGVGAEARAGEATVESPGPSAVRAQHKAGLMGKIRDWFNAL